MWIVDTANALKSTVGDVIDNLDGLIDSAVGDFDQGGDDDEAELLKEILVETQLKQVKACREYQKLFDEKEKEIADLRSKLGEGEGEGKSEGDDAASDAGKVTPSKHVPTPMSSVWELKLREIITEKNVAEKVRLQAERKVEKLERKNEELRVRCGANERALETMADRCSKLESREGGQAEGLDKIAVQYSRLVADAGAQSEHDAKIIKRLAREKDELAVLVKTLKASYIELVETSNKQMEIGVIPRSPTGAAGKQGDEAIGMESPGLIKGKKGHTIPHDFLQKELSKKKKECQRLVLKIDELVKSGKLLRQELDQLKAAKVEKTGTEAAAAGEGGGGSSNRGMTPEVESKVRKIVKKLKTELAMEKEAREKEALAHASALEDLRARLSAEGTNGVESALAQAALEADARVADERAKFAAQTKELENKLEKLGKDKARVEAELANERKTLQAQLSSEREAREEEKAKLKEGSKAEKSELGVAHENEKKQMSDKFETEKTGMKERFEAERSAMKELFETKKSEMKDLFDTEKTEMEKRHDAEKSKMKESFETERNKMEESFADERKEMKESFEQEKTEMTEKAKEASRKAISLAKQLAQKDKARAVEEATRTAQERADQALAKAVTELRAELEASKEAAVSSALEEQEIKLQAEFDDAKQKLKVEASKEKQKAVVKLTLQHQKALSEAKAAHESAMNALQTAYDDFREEHEAKIVAARQEAEAQVRLELKEEIAETRQRFVMEAEKRRKLHQKIVEMNGNIRVFCRVRPVLAVEEKHAASTGNGIVTAVNVDEDLDGSMIVKKDAATRQRFEYDAIFAPGINGRSTQKDVFERVSPFVTSALDGYNVCIFAYGQTGSGKTYTMIGEEGNGGENRGVIHRTLGAMFEESKKRLAMGETESCEFFVEILEVYNEMVRDLLAPPSAKGGGEGHGLDIRLDPENPSEVIVVGLSMEPVESIDDVEKLLSQANKNRAVGGHNMNERSSRSHLVMSISMEAKVRRKASAKSKKKGATTLVTVTSKMNLIDLAGSERLSKTGASGQQLKEAQSINKSLSALGDVIAALGDKKGKKGHVPYRNSKLTHLLQPSLSGNAKVLMFVNTSPVQWNVSETLCSLQFASRCAAVKLGTAKKNSEGSQVTKLKAKIAELEDRLGGGAAAGGTAGGRRHTRIIG